MIAPDVKFADVEDALRDRDRLQWLLPVVDGSRGEAIADQRTVALAQGLVQGLSGVALVDWARERCVS